jgi:hypothetical protein
MLPFFEGKTPMRVLSLSPAPAAPERAVGRTPDLCVEAALRLETLPRQTRPVFGTLMAPAPKRRQSPMHIRLRAVW